MNLIFLNLSLINSGKEKHNESNNILIAAEKKLKSSNNKIFTTVQLF